jgi:excisionase family DNA binding protein
VYRAQTMQGLAELACEDYQKIRNLVLKGKIRHYWSGSTRLIDAEHVKAFMERKYAADSERLGVDVRYFPDSERS